jgi:hypothetical protein
MRETGFGNPIQAGQSSGCPAVSIWRHAVNPCVKINQHRAKQEIHKAPLVKREIAYQDALHAAQYKRVIPVNVLSELPGHFSNRRTDCQGRPEPLANLVQTQD